MSADDAGLPAEAPVLKGAVGDQPRQLGPEPVVIRRLRVIALLRLSDRRRLIAEAVKSGRSLRPEGLRFIGEPAPVPVLARPAGPAVQPALPAVWKPYRPVAGRRKARRARKLNRLTVGVRGVANLISAAELQPAYWCFIFGGRYRRKEGVPTVGGVK